MKKAYICLAVFSVAAVWPPGQRAAESAEPEGPRPTSVADSVKVIDLRSWPLASGAVKPAGRNLVHLRYDVAGKVRAIFEQQRKQLAEKGWAELPGGYLSDETATAAFKNQGHFVSLSASGGVKPGMVSVTVSNHGNVDLTTLPAPEGAKPFYSIPSVVSYTSEAPADQVAKVCRDQFLALGWMPYGDAGDQHFFKKNAVRLSAFIRSAPAQGGKTVVSYSTELMSADLNALADAKKLQYSDSPAQILFDTKTAKPDVVDFYKKSLAGDGWNPTLENLTEQDFREFMIFRNPRKEMLTLTIDEIDDFRRVVLKFETAEEVAETARRLDELAVKKMLEERKAKMKRPPLVRITIPKNAKDFEQTRTRIEFKLEPGQAKAVVESLRKELAGAGWKETITSAGDQAGAVSFEKGDQDVTLFYTDTGFLPAEISLSAIRAELERVPDQK